MKPISAFGVLAVLAALPAAPALAQGVGIETVPVTGTILEVTAEGEALRVPDRALVGAGVVTQAPAAVDAARENATRMAAVVAALRRAGIAERDLKTTSVTLSPQYRYVEGQPPAITGYQAASQVEVRFRDVARSGPVLDALVAAGANQINGPTLLVDQPEAARDEARTQAMERARVRADLYARAAGLRVKRLLTISESGGDMPYAPPMMVRTVSMDSAQSASTEVLPGEQRIAVTVAVRFELE